MRKEEWISGLMTELFGARSLSKNLSASSNYWAAAAAAGSTSIFVEEPQCILKLLFHFGLTLESDASDKSHELIQTQATRVYVTQTTVASQLGVLRLVAATANWVVVRCPCLQSHTTNVHDGAQKRMLCQMLTNFQNSARLTVKLLR